MIHIYWLQSNHTKGSEFKGIFLESSQKGKGNGWLVREYHWNLETKEATYQKL